MMMTKKSNSLFSSMFLTHALLFFVALFMQNNLQAQCETGVTISSASGDKVVYTCPGDGNDDIIEFANTHTGAADFVYVITDANNTILGIPPGNSQNFEGAGIGDCRVWGFSYTGNILASPGESVFSTFFSDGCWAISNDFLEVIRTTPDGGTVAMPSGATEREVCASDGYDDPVVFTHQTTSNAAYRYVVTDDQNNILGLPGNSLNFEGVPPGVCRVWGLSYTGNLTAGLGDNAATATLTDGCWDLSSNFITITRTDVVGGTVADSNGESVLFTCPGDGVDDIVNFTHQTTSGAAYGYIITDDNNYVLGVPPGNSQNFEGAGAGICRVWGISYTGTLNVWPGDLLTNKSLSSGCFDLSDNFIEVNRGGEDGGTVAMPSGATTRYTCPGDGVDDIVMATTTSTAANYQYVVTDDQNIIIGLPPGNTVNAEGAGPGICRIWGLAYSGNLTAQVGDNAATASLADGCFGLSSNFITLIRDTPNGGEVAFDDGSTAKSVCTSDGMDDLLTFTHQTSSMAAYRYVVTDDQNNILGLPPGNSVNFEGVPAGVCRVWGLSYTGMVTAQVGDNAAMVDLTNDCFELSSNFLTVTRTDDVDGGTVADVNGETELFTCPGDGIDDIIMASHVTTSAANYAYVVTDDQNIILGIPPGNTVNAEGAGPGICRIWGLSYTGTITAQPGDNAAAIALTDGCFELSSNFITLNRNGQDGGTVAMPSGATTRYTCPGDGVDDIVMATTTSNATNYQYVVTDDQNTIIGLPPGNTVNAEGAGPGICRIWGLAYDGNLTAQVGDNAAMASLADGCFALSSNFITLIRDTPDGGSVATTAGETTVYTCPGDGAADIVEFMVSGNSNSQFAYVVTDDQNNILGIPSGNSQNFEGAPAGTCRVWGLAYTGTITAQAGDNAAMVDLTDGCFDLSDNFVTVVRDLPNGGTVSTADGENSVYTCTQDGEPDIIEFAHANASNSNYQYVITDDQNIILALPGGNSADVDGAPPGTCRVWGFAYTGDLTAQAGDHVFSTLFSTDCWAISSNFITVNRDVPDGGTVSTTSGATSVTVTVGDAIPDVISFAHANASNSLYTYVITDDQNNILGIPPGNSQDFNGAPPGICRVWGLAYTGSIWAQPGDNAATVALTDDCFNLSSNYIEINRINNAPNNIVNNNNTLGQNRQVNTEKGISLAPNPALDMISARFEIKDEIAETATVSVYNLAGQELSRERYDLTKGDHTLELDVNELDDGMYFLMIRSGSVTLQERFMKAGGF